jgi:protein TonB
MSNASVSRRRPEHWQQDQGEPTLASVIPLKNLSGGSVLPDFGAVLAGTPGLGYWRPDTDQQDRKWVDALIGVALVVLAHYTIIDFYRHQPPKEPVPPKETEVQISLVRPPPPPPPPPVVQPQPRPAPPKDAIPPKPKPKPKKVPPPVVEQPPIQTPSPVVSDAPPAPMKAAPAPAPKPVERVVNVSNADYLRKPEPEYPEDAMDRGWQGKVLVKARILASGQTDNVQVQKSSGHASLDAAAIKAVKRAVFKPNMQGDTATTVFALIPIVFQL